MSAPEPLEELCERRRLAAERVAELTFDLGGLTYEMAGEGRFDHEVLERRAAALRAADADLGELDRLLAEASGLAGTCRRCEASFGRGAIFCWRCGESLAYAVPRLVG